MFTYFSKFFWAHLPWSSDLRFQHISSAFHFTLRIYLFKNWL